MQVPALERWTNLETLILDWCDLLNHLTLSMPRLKKISLRHCKMLTSVSPCANLCICSEQGCFVQVGSDSLHVKCSDSLSHRANDIVALSALSLWLEGWGIYHSKMLNGFQADKVSLLHSA